AARIVFFMGSLREANWALRWYAKFWNPPRGRGQFFWTARVSPSGPSSQRSTSQLERFTQLGQYTRIAHHLVERRRVGAARQHLAFLPARHSSLANHQTAALAATVAKAAIVQGHEFAVDAQLEAAQ